MLNPFLRTEMLIGSEALDRLKNKKIAIFGIGGVGSFVAEGLARTGVEAFVLIDHDDICVTNINRQIHATTKTVGRSKVEVMKERILEINPKAKVDIFKMLYNGKSAAQLLSSDYSYVVDAIDMVSSKLDLIERCSRLNIPIISSMGAGNKLNPTQLEVTDIHQTSVCPLARVMRAELRKRNILSLKVVYSKEKPLIPLNIESKDTLDSISKGNNSIIKRQTPGSVAFVPPVAGLIIASEVVKDIMKEEI